MRIISGAFRGRTLKTVSGPGYRPAMSRVRESLFSSLESRGVVWSAVDVLDLFAGSGSLSFEALSRGTPLAVFVEKDRKAAECIKRNAATLGVLEKCRIVADDVLKVTAKAPTRQFGVIFIDPPYAQNFFPLTLRNLVRRNWLAEGGFVIAEVEKHFKLPPHLGEEYGLELDTDRTYGQTRIIIYRAPEGGRDAAAEPGVDDDGRPEQTRTLS